MKHVVCIYLEGLELKLAVLGREKNQIFLYKTLSVNSKGLKSVDSTESIGNFSIDSMEMDEISFDSLDGMSEIQEEKKTDTSEVSIIAAKLVEFNLSKASFIPVVTEPNVTFHIYEGLIEKDKKKNINKIILEI